MNPAINLSERALKLFDSLPPEAKDPIIRADILEEKLEDLERDPSEKNIVDVALNAWWLELTAPEGTEVEKEAVVETAFFHIFSASRLVWPSACTKEEHLDLLLKAADARFKVLEDRLAKTGSMLNPNRTKLGNN